MINRDEIEGKLVQALLVWKQQGGPKSISVADATMIASQKNPGVTESDMRSIVRSANTLDLEGDEIVLGSDLTGLM